MIVYRGLKDRRLRRKPRALAIGIFDGVHRGHALILSKAIQAARRLKAGVMVVTFDPHPQKVLFPKKASPKILMSLAHRLRVFESLGASETLVIPFNKKIARLGHEVFLQDILLGRLGMRALSVGDDFCFGRHAAGDRNYLIAQSRRLGFALALSKPVRRKKRIISSTEIRRLVEKGQLKPASAMLGRPVSLYGDVVRGRGRGKRVGYATANLNPHHETLPPPGVYAAYGRLNGRRLKSVVHIGPRPTFGDREKSVEAHFLDFRASLYGREIELQFLARLRGIRRFKTPAALQAQIVSDIRRARRHF